VWNKLPCSIGFAILSVSPAFAQSTFEVASVKPSAPGGGEIGSMNGGPMSPGPFNMAGHDPELGNRLRSWRQARSQEVLETELPD